MIISSLSVSGQCSSGKSTLSKLLVHKFNWKYVSVGKEVQRLATEYGFPIEKFGLIPDDILHGIEDKNGQRIKSERNIVWDGRLTCFLARSYKRVLKVYCYANFEKRAKRTSSKR
jgi:cytidylate kinase